MKKQLQAGRGHSPPALRLCDHIVLATRAYKREKFKFHLKSVNSELSAFMMHKYSGWFGHVAKNVTFSAY